jgi:hypothetical protein
MNWERHLKILLGTFAGAVAVLYLFVLAMNPFGNLPAWALGRHVIMDDNQRFQYPAIIRSGHYDSIVIGTSTARLLEPVSLESIFGGHFANLAMNAGTAWEQYRTADLFLKEVSAPRTLVVGLDHVWCRADADTQRITPRGFPEWMFDADPWNDLVYLLNSRTVEIAGRRLGNALGLAPARWPDNGYEVFTPPESAYDLAKAKAKIYGSGTRQISAGLEPVYAADAAERAAWTFPALAWLEEIIAKDKWQRVLLVFMPVHRAAQPRAGSMAAAREAECKARIALIAARAGWPALDFRIASEITTTDSNYWDSLHYRVGIAERVARGIARGIAGQDDDPAGDWRHLRANREAAAALRDVRSD